MSAATIARLKITLDDVKPVVLRRVEVPFDIRLDRLHLTIQAAMGWTNSHLYEIRAGGVGWSTPYPDADWAGDFIDARKARLGDILEDIGTKTLKYLYDFGDGWEHTIKVERSIDREPGMPLSALDRSQGPLPARGHRWSLGLWRVPRGHRRSRPRAPSRTQRMVRRRLQSACGRRRSAVRRRRRAGSALVAPTRRKAPPYCLTRGAHRMPRRRRGCAGRARA